MTVKNRADSCVRMTSLMIGIIRAIRPMKLASVARARAATIPAPASRKQ